MLAVAVGQALTRYMHELLDLMFNCGLSDPLVQAMKSLAENIKPLLPTIQGKPIQFLMLMVMLTRLRHTLTLHLYYDYHFRSITQYHLSHIERPTIQSTWRSRYTKHNTGGRKATA
jgi:hypothetical protein